MKRENEFRYTKLANILRDQIVTGFIKPGQYLLSENELCRHYNLSRSSVRKALDQLFEEKLIIKRVGQGTIVSPDLVVAKDKTKTLRILVSSPSYFAEFGMPTIERAFRERYPHVDLKMLYISSVSFGELFEASKEMGFRPDLLFVAEQQHQQFKQEFPDEFVDLKPELAAEFAAMYPKLAHAFSDAGKQLAAPVTFSPVFLVYNPQLFERFGATMPHPNWTKDEFLTAAKLLTRDTDGDGINDTCGFALPINMSRWPAIAIRGGVRFRPDDDVEPLERAFHFLHDMLYRYRNATLANRTRLNSESFSRSKAAMVLTTTLELTNWKRAGLPFEPRIAPMPFGTDPASLLIANVFMVPKECEDTELAYAFIRLALDPDIQERIGRSASFLSVIPGVNEALLDPADRHALRLAPDDLNGSYFINELLPDAEMLGEIDREMDMFWSGLESAESFARRVRDILRQQ